MCMEQSFDLHNNTEFCPPERNVLKEIYLHAKGEEWTFDNGWKDDEYEDHCKWHGVTCDNDKLVTELRLESNRLAGTLSTRIGDLSYLQVLDLSDNNLQVLGLFKSEF